VNLLSRIRGGEERSAGPLSMDQVAQMLNGYALNSGYMQPMLQQTLAGDATERPTPTFEGLAREAYGANGVVFACMLVRQLVFSSIRFSFQRSIDGRPADIFGHSDLNILERPWVGGTTQDMLSRMIQDADLAGNSFWVRNGDELVRLRPDWVEIVGRKRVMNGGHVGFEKIGYLYSEGGVGNDPVPFLAADVAHFAPIKDPLSRFSGMSWLTPILREVQADQAMGKHQRKFFDNAATPNMIMKHEPSASIEKIKRFAEIMRDESVGVDNAWKTLHLYPGADATVVGADMKQIDFATVRGTGETRIAAAAGVPPVIVGLSEGLAAATYSNYGQARRRLADGTAHPLWQNLAGCLERIVTPKGAGVRLWYDASDVPFLREDEKDAADIQKTRAETINTLITAGYEPASVIQAVDANDLRLLQHTGMTSVQLIRPGAAQVEPDKTEPAAEPPEPAADPTKEISA
jgi:phage portal protein BeeE